MARKKTLDPRQLLGLRVRRYRELRGISTTQLAEAIGVHGRVAIGRYERGDRTMDILTLLAIARALDVLPSALVDGL